VSSIPAAPVAALIPAWNEAARLAPVVREACRFVPVLVVDDGSHDSTAQVATQAGATVVRHPGNRGKGAALRTGFAWALGRGHQAVITLDADGQHDAADIPQFLQVWSDRGSDLVIGRRDFRQMPFPRRYVNPFGSWLLSLALRTPVYDNQCGYRLYSRSLMARVAQGAAGFEFEVEVILQAVVHGMRIDWVNVRTIYDTGKVSYFRPLPDSLVFLRTVWRAARILRQERRRR
jgi:glycosyltransferase involved in cell wall biosynthesis